MTIKRSQNSILIVALISSVLAVAGGGNLTIFLGLSETLGIYFIVIGFFIMGLLMGFIAPSMTSLSDLLLYSYGAIIVGDLVDVYIDWFFRSRDRNLFPLEIILLWILSTIPLILGIKVIRKLKTKNK